MDYRIALHTEIGIQKETNQDSCCVKVAETDKGKVLLAVICDGMGGLSKGEVASATVLKAFEIWFEEELPVTLAMEDPLSRVEARWQKIIEEQNRKIAAYGKMLKIQLGSTITAMLILEDHRYVIVHVGDSRAYKITNDAAIVLTEDQTVVAKEVKQGRLTPEEAEADPRRNVLLQCVGASRIVVPEFYFGSVKRDECYMLCSDGFRHVVKAEEIQHAFAPENNETESKMRQNTRDMVELNMYRHETDNISVILVKIEGEV